MEPESGTSTGTGVARRLDEFQRRHRWAGFPVAVIYKFVDDQGTYQAALLTYYGFVSLFPLLLLAVTVLGYVLAGDPGAQQAVLTSALRNVPVLGDQIGANVHSLHGNLFALIISIVVSLYGALGITQAMLTAMDRMWVVPVADRPSLPAAYLRGLATLVVLALSLVITTVLAGLATVPDAPAWFGPVLRLVPSLVAIVVNAGLFLACFALLTTRRLGLAQLWPGAVMAAVAWQILQLVGTYLISHQLVGSTASYGFFGIVLGLLAWLYLAAFAVLLCVEINAVRALHLSPRSLFAVAPTDADMTDGDQRALTAYARTERRKSFQRVDVTFGPESGPEPSAPSAHPAAALPSGSIPAPRDGADDHTAGPESDVRDASRAEPRS